MRFVSALIVIFVMTVCSESKGISQTHGGTAGPRKGAINSVVQFLIASAAIDFHAHGPHSVGFRELRIGHVITPNGQKEYMLCGQFLPASEGGKAKWTPFVTIKTSGYEQYIRGQAATFCQDSSVIWDVTKDLSSLLQNRLDSLR